MSEYQIIPDILTNSMSELSEKLKMVKNLTDLVHIDVIDGKFADNKTLMPVELKKMEWEDLKVDVQLMTENPVQYVSDLEFASRVIGHVEIMRDEQSFFEACEKHQVIPGLGLNIETGFDQIDLEVLMKAGVILLMSVKVGFSGQQFLDEVLYKIQALRKMGYKGDVVIDGGVNLETIPNALLAGANQFAVNSGLWQTEDVDKRYQDLVELLPK